MTTIAMSPIASLQHRTMVHIYFSHQDLERGKLSVRSFKAMAPFVTNALSDAVKHEQVLQRERPTLLGDFLLVKGLHMFTTKVEYMVMTTPLTGERVMTAGGHQSLT